MSFRAIYASTIAEKILFLSSATRQCRVNLCAHQGRASPPEAGKPLEEIYLDYGQRSLA